MTLILETGAGVQSANAYVTTAFVDNYLSNRNRSTENGWDTAATNVKEAAVISATQYIDNRFALRWKGEKEVYFKGQFAEAIISASGQPNDDDTIVIGAITFVFKTTLSTLTSEKEVEIGATVADTISNLVDVINAESQDAGAEVNETTNTQIDLTALQEGESGNDITFSTAIAGWGLTGFVNGVDDGAQRLQWPRCGVYEGGRAVVGIPRGLKWAVAEYAVRAVSSELFQDPTVDPSGRAVIKEKIGPIETEYAEGAALDLLIRPYPAADYMLKPYLKPTGAIR